MVLLRRLLNRGHQYSTRFISSNAKLLSVESPLLVPLPPEFNASLFAKQLPSNPFGAYSYYKLCLFHYTDLHCRIPDADIVKLLLIVGRSHSPTKCITRMDAILHNRFLRIKKLPTLQMILIYLDYAVLTRNLAAQRKAFSWIDQSQIGYDNALFHKLITIYARNGDSAGVSRVYDSMASKRVVPDENNRSTLLKFWAKNGDVSSCKKISYEYSNPAKSAVQVLQGLLSTGNVSEAYRFSADSLKKERNNYLSLLNVWITRQLKSGDAVDTLKLVGILVEKKQLSSNVFRRTIFDAFMASRESSSRAAGNNVEKLALAFIADGICPDSYALCCLANGYFKRKSASKAYELIDYLFLGVQNRELSLSLFCYALLIGGSLQVNDIQLAKKLYWHMLRHGGAQYSGITPDSHILHMFLVFHIRTRKRQAGLSMYKTVVEDGAKPNERVLKAVMELAVNDVKLCQAYWNQFCSYKNGMADGDEFIPKGTLKLQKSHHVDAGCFRPIFVALVRNGMYSGALSILEQLRHHGLQPTKSMYDSVLIALSKRGAAPDVDKLINCLKDNGQIVDTKIRNIQIYTYRNCNQLKFIEETVAEMDRCDISLNARTFEQLIMAYIEQAHIMKAAEWYAKMKKQNLCTRKIDYIMKVRGTYSQEKLDRQASFRITNENADLNGPIKELVDEFLKPWPPVTTSYTRNPSDQANVLENLLQYSPLSI